MRTKSVAAVAVISLMAMILVPFCTESDADSVTDYTAQLDDNGLKIREQVMEMIDRGYKSPQNTIQVDVRFDSIVIFESTEAAMKYIEDTVKKVLFSIYYSEPMAVWLWDLPVSVPDISGVTQVVRITSSSDPGREQGYFSPEKASFTLSVPSSCIDDPATEGNELKDILDKVEAAVFEVSGSVYSSVKAIADRLRSVKVVEDEEGTVSNVYDALVGKSSSDAGIASAFTLVARSNGLSALTVAGMVGTDSQSEGYWNAVLADGAWYGCDATIYDGKDRSPLMAGTQTVIVYDSSQERFGTVHTAGDGVLDPIKISVSGYDWPDDRGFFEKWGSQIAMAALVAIIVLTLLYAVRSGSV